MRCRGRLSHFSPDPLSPALLGLLALNNPPPPPGGGRSRRRSVCGCWRWVGLLASRYVVPLSRYRSFAIAVLFVLRCGLLACRCRGRCRCSLISSSHHIVVRCRPAFPACLRLVFPSSRPISSPVVSPVASPFFDTVGLGVRRGASVSYLLGFVLRSASVSIAGSWCFLCGAPSLGLLACRLGCVEMAFSSRPCVMCGGVLAYRLPSRLVPRLGRRLVGRVGSASLAPSCDTMGGEEGDCGLLIVFRSDFFAACLVPVLACLGLFLAPPMMWMAAGG